MKLYKYTLGSQVYKFNGLKEVLAKATLQRSGDQLAGIAAEDERQRISAQLTLADIPLKDFLQFDILPPEIDEVSRLIVDQHQKKDFALISSMTVGEFRDWLLSDKTTVLEIEKIKWGLTPEMVAAVSKIMRNQDLILVSKKIQVITRFRNTLGLPGRLAVRLQPNHPTDDPAGVLASIVDGIMYGCGDAVIGINPASDNIPKVIDLLKMFDQLIHDFQIPTQNCVLSHVTNQMQAIQQKAPLDLVFQSIAGTELTNKSFGIHLEMLREAQQMALELKRGTLGNNVMYFETGQGSCLSAKGHHDIDQQTLEVRAYAVARQYAPLLVNSVVGFIGPEYLYNGKQIIRAGLEDHFCGKLMGLPMGIDVCYTNHAEADQDDMDVLLTLLGAAGCNYIMGVPGADDIMLNYQSTSFHDALYVREVLNLKPAPEFESWLIQNKIFDSNGKIITSNEVTIPLLTSMSMLNTDAKKN